MAPAIEWWRRTRGKRAEASCRRRDGTCHRHWRKGRPQVSSVILLRWDALSITSTVTSHIFPFDRSHFYQHPSAHGMELYVHNLISSAPICVHRTPCGRVSYQIWSNTLNPPFSHVMSCGTPVKELAVSRRSCMHSIKKWTACGWFHSHNLYRERARWN